MYVIQTFFYTVTPDPANVRGEPELGASLDSVTCALRCSLPAVWGKAATTTRCGPGHSCEQAPAYEVSQLVGI